jgi:hypothetical protein
VLKLRCEIVKSLILVMMQKDDPFFMMNLRNSAKNKEDFEKTEAKSILKKIETESKLTAKDEKWITCFKTRHEQPFHQIHALDHDDGEYEFDQGDLVTVEKALQEYQQDSHERYDQQSRNEFFTVETIEDILAESKQKSEDLLAEVQRISCDEKHQDRTAAIGSLVEQIKAEESIQKKNTSVHVYSLDFQTIRDSQKLQNLVVRCERILLRQFFHAHFLPGQLQSILCTLTKACDCVASMRTGGGKTMIFAIPALLEDQKTAIVFSPLKSLIIDQMNELKKLGIASGLLIPHLPVCL